MALTLQERSGSEEMDIVKRLDNIKVPKGPYEYWDVRVELTNKTEIRYEDYDLLACSKKPSLGAFIRVYQGGMWFYASTTNLDTLDEQIFELSNQASSLKNENDKKRISPFNTEASEDRLINSEKIRMDKVSIIDKKNLCESYFNFTKSFVGLRRIQFNYVDEYKTKYFISSTEVKYSYDFNQCGLSISYSVVNGENSFDDRITFYGSKFDDLKNLNEKIKESIEESFLFTDAKKIAPGEYPVVMDSEVVGVFAHESFGHKSEADFMLGNEEAKEYWRISKKVGSDCLSIIDHGEKIGTSGYCPIDDEGFKTQKTYLIKNGILTGRLHSQHTSQVLNEAPTGNGRAMNFEFEPIVRMTNTYVAPGELSFEELISKVKFGIYAKGVNHGSGLSTFTIAPKKCYMIRDGKISEPIRVSVISGTVFETLNHIEACSKKLNIVNTAFGGCGKMEQWPLPVAFGGSKVLVSKMLIS